MKLTQLRKQSMLLGQVQLKDTKVPEPGRVSHEPEHCTDGAAIAGEGATIDLTRGNIEPTANPPPKVAVLTTTAYLRNTINKITALVE